MSSQSSAPDVGRLLRAWRQRRRLTQLALSLQAGVSAKHLSFLETGRSSPSREMLVHLAEHLELPLRERNILLTAAGYASLYTETDLEAPEMSAVHAAINRLLVSHEPYPAVVVDRWWNMLSANASVAVLTEGVADELLQPPANVLRASLHPRGLAPRVRNIGEWRSHLIRRLRGQIDKTGDPELANLLDEIVAYGGSEPDLAETYAYRSTSPLRTCRSRRSSQPTRRHEHGCRGIPAPADLAARRATTSA